MTTTFQFWSGLDTIGANVVELKGKTGRVICDFGMRPGSDMPIGDAALSATERQLLSGNLPAIPHLYDTLSFQKLTLADYREDPYETAIFISHLHLDHMGGLQYLPTDTNVYASEETVKLYHALVEAGLQTPLPVNFHAIPYDEPIQVGDIQVLLKATDHDTVGPASIWLQTEDLKVIHSGDLRMNGFHPENMQKWCQAAHDWQPDVLLLEGTNFSFETNVSEKVETEAGIVNKWRKLLQGLPDEIIMFNPYPRNVERMKVIAEVTKQTGRTMVFEPAFAHVVHAFYPTLEITVCADLPVINANTFKSVSLAEMQANPGKYVLQNSLPNLDVIQLFGKGIYAHSNGEPLGDFDPRYFGLLEKLDQAQFDYHVFGTPGHATREELLQMAAHIQAKVTIPWHTTNAALFLAALEREGIPAIRPTLFKLYANNQLF